MWNLGKPFDKNAIKIGVIYVDNAQTGYSLAHEIGVREAQQALELRDDQVIRKFDVDDTDLSMVESAFLDLIAEGANIVIATSWGFMDACEKLAEKFPNVVFAHGSGYKSNKTNFTNYFGRIYQARYLSGIVAGLKTKTNKIGYVAAKDKSNSEVTGGVNAFALGVASVNPEAKVYTIVTHSWLYPAGERKATQRLVGEGSDVIAQHCNTSTPQVEAEKAGVWGIGYNIDMQQYAPKAVLTSVIWNWGIYYKSLINSVIDGTFTTEPYFGGLADGLVDIAPLNSELTTSEMDAMVAAAKNSILNENFKIFEKDGKALSDEEIRSEMNWYVHNVIEIK